MRAMGAPRWSCDRATIAVALFTCFALCNGSHGLRGRPAPAVFKPLMLVESGLGQGLGQGSTDDSAFVDFDQLLNLLQAKGKRSQELADKGLTRELVTQVLQPGNTGMWFGPRLGRRRRRSAGLPPVERRKRSLPQLQDGDMDNEISWKLAELLRDLQGPKRSPAPCDPSEINCLLANLASGTGGYVSSEQEQRPRSEGNLVNFTPRLGRESGEQSEDDSSDGFGGVRKYFSAPSRQLRTDSEPVWGFSPRLGRRLLPAGVVDVHAAANAPPLATGLVPRAHGEPGVPGAAHGRAARSMPKVEDVGAASQEHGQQ